MSFTGAGATLPEELRQTFVGSTAFAQADPLPLSNKVPLYGGSMEHVRAFDGSNYTTGTGPGGDLTPQDVERMIQAGVHLGIVQALTPPQGYPHAGDSGMSARMGRAIVDGGMDLDAYLYWIDGGAPFAQKIALLEGLDVRRWWVDLEERTPMPAYSLNASITYALQQADSAPTAYLEAAGIYTAWWWVQWFLQSGGKLELLQNRPLWWVWDDGSADPTLDRIPADKRPSAFGLDDSRVCLVQYNLSTSVVGVSGIDLSVLSSEEGDTLMANVIQVPQEYRDKFALSGPYDWPGVAANLEGIIHELQTTATVNADHSDADAAIQEVRDVLTKHGYVPGA